jgi:hypothetical protein
MKVSWRLVSFLCVRTRGSAGVIMEVASPSLDKLRAVGERSAPGVAHNWNNSLD